jgi:hypothetical protein
LTLVRDSDGKIQIRDGKIRIRDGKIRIRDGKIRIQDTHLGSATLDWMLFTKPLLVEKLEEARGCIQPHQARILRKSPGEIFDESSVPDP